MLITWSITTLNQEFLTLSPFVSCLRAKGTQHGSYTLLGCKDLYLYLNTTSLIHSSLKCFLYSLRMLLSTYICTTAFAERFQSGLWGFLFHSKALLRGINYRHANTGFATWADLVPSRWTWGGLFFHFYKAGTNPFCICLPEISLHPAPAPIWKFTFCEFACQCIVEL